MSVGVGPGNVGGQLQWLPNDTDATASTRVAQQNLGILPDTLQRPISDIDRDATWKYKSAAGNPSLASPLMRVREAGIPEEKVTVADVLKELVDQLPEEVRTALLKDSIKSKEDRDAHLAALAKLLGKTAKALHWLRRQAKRHENEEEEDEEEENEHQQ